MRVRGATLKKSTPLMSDRLRRRCRAALRRCAVSNLHPRCCRCSPCSLFISSCLEYIHGSSLFQPLRQHCQLSRAGPIWAKSFPQGEKGKIAQGCCFFFFSFFLFLCVSVYCGKYVLNEADSPHIQRNMVWQCAWLLRPPSGHSCVCAEVEISCSAVKTLHRPGHSWALNQTTSVWWMRFAWLSC